MFNKEFDIKNVVKKLGVKNIVLILLAGILLIYIATPMDKKVNKDEDIEIEKTQEEKSIVSNTEYVEEQENKLQRVLMSISGVEEAKVMITLKSSREEVILKDKPYTKEENGKENVYESGEETVMVENNMGNTLPYVVKELNPQIEGIVVVIKSNYINMEQEINDIVLALFDIPVHKIKVMNMKS